MLILAMGGRNLSAADSDISSKTADRQPGSTLADRQAIVRDRVGRLEDRMFQLSQALRKSDPDKAGRLLEGLGALRGNLIRDRINTIVKRLRKEQYSDAADGQRAVVDDLQTLLKLLVEDPDHIQERKDEIERLKAIRQSLDHIIQEQGDERAAAKAAEKTEEQAAALAATAKKLQNLIDRQKNISAQTLGSLQKRPDTTRQQAQIRRETDTLAAEIEKIADLPGGASSADNPKSDAPGSDAQSSGGGEHSKQAVQDLHQASTQMKSAEASLDQGKAAEAKHAQDSAVQNLKRALDNVNRQAKALRKKLKLAKQAEQQRKTAEKTEKLSDEMKGGQDSQGGDQGAKSGGKQGAGQQGSKQGGKPQAGQSNQSKGGKQNDDSRKEGQEDQSTPGQEGVEQAVPLQKQAAEQLKNKQAGKASEKQEEAIEKLKNARNELEDRLDQLRREQQEEMLAALESRFRAMLARQLECNKATTRLAELGSENWKRSDQLELTEWSQKQRWVGDQADEALSLLVEEGSTVILPQLLKQVRDDGRDVADRLAAADAGPTVRTMQSDLAQVLRDIIGAIKKKQEDLENQSGAGGGESGKSSPLLPGSAELKLLRSCQLRVNSETVTLDDHRNVKNAVMAEIEKQLKRLSKRQADIAKMTKEMHEAMRHAQ